MQTQLETRLRSLGAAMLADVLAAEVQHHAAVIEAGDPGIAPEDVAAQIAASWEAGTLTSLVVSSLAEGLGSSATQADVLAALDGVDDAEAALMAAAGALDWQAYTAAMRR